MPSCSESFLHTQIGRAMKMHYEPAPGVRRKAMSQAGLFMGTTNGRMKMNVSSPGRDSETVTIDINADQPAFPERDGEYSIWWEWIGAQR